MSEHPPSLIKADSDRPRLNFSALKNFSPELAERSLLIRSRVKDLRRKFHADADWALENFNRLTGLALITAAIGVIVALIISLYAPKHTFAVFIGIAIGGLVGLVTAGTKAFGWHQRYQAMFHARWAMSALEIVIDQELHEIALGLPPEGKLTEADRQRLTASVRAWIEEFRRILNTFGESYGAALSPVELEKIIGKTK